MEKAKIEIFKKITESLHKILTEEEELEKSDKTNRIFKGEIEDIIETVLDKFENFASKNQDKKSFISSLVKLFAILQENATL